MTTTENGDNHKWCKCCHSPQCTQHNTAINVFGNAPSTISGKNTAFHVFNLYQAEARSGDHHFDDLVPKDMENNNLEDLVTSLAHYMGRVPIRHSNNTGKILGSESLGQYFGWIMVLLQEKFPKQEVWADDTWSKSLKAGLICAAQPREIQGTDGKYKDPKICSLYKWVMPQLVQASERNFGGWKEPQGADLKSVNWSLIHWAGGMAPENSFRHAVINITTLGVGWGGEAKFLQYNNWLYDRFWESQNDLDTVENYDVSHTSLGTRLLLLSCWLLSLICSILPGGEWLIP